MGDITTRKKLGNLHSFADALVDVDGSMQLVEQLGVQLKRIGAEPSRLYLLDEGSMQLYAAKSFGCAGNDSDVEDLDADVLSEEHEEHFHLYSQGDPTGLLFVDKSANVDRELMQQMCILLGPALNAVQRQDVSLQELRNLHEQMRLFTGTGELLSHVDVSVLLVRILETVMTAVKAQVAAVLTIENGKLIPQVVWGFSEHHIDELKSRDGRRMVDIAYEQQTKMCLHGDELQQQVDTESFSAVLDGLLMLPISGKNIHHGLIVLANPKNHFNEQTMRLADIVCDMAAIALDNAALIQDTVDKERLARDVEIAQGVQSSMFPSEAFEHHGLYITGRSDPCDETGGDYFTYLGHGSEVYAVIGDVTGHGLGAALYTTMAHAIVQQQLHAGVGVEEGSNGISMALRHANSERFMTAVLMAFDYKHHQFCYVSAGHNPILWIHEGEAIWLESNCLPLGIMMDVPCQRSKIRDYCAGDYFILYTDGFVEAMNPDGEYYGEQRLQDLMLDGIKESPDVEDLMKVLYADTEAWLAGEAPDDDLTIVVVKCQDLPSAASS